MKIAVVGTEPASCMLAPYGDRSWQIWGCSPGLYPVAPRADRWFELHRWEPPVIGKPSQQKPWFSPEYVQWLSMFQGPVYMIEHVHQVPNSVALPAGELVKKYGHYFFTSSLAWMLAMAIEEIEVDRVKRKEAAAKAEAERIARGEPENHNLCAMEPDMIGLFGVDMSAQDEYQLQRPGCHFFIQMAHSRGIQIVVPDESDILCPPPLYGVSESWHRRVKFLKRREMIEGLLNQSRMSLSNMQRQVAFYEGALDDIQYHDRTWVHDGNVVGAHVAGILAGDHIYEPDPVPAEPEHVVEGRRVFELLGAHHQGGESPVECLRRIVSERDAACALLKEAGERQAAATRTPAKARRKR